MAELAGLAGGGSAAPCRPPAGAAARRPVPAAGSQDVNVASKALSLFLGMWEGAGWVGPQLWPIQLFSTSTTSASLLEESFPKRARRLLAPEPWIKGGGPSQLTGQSGLAQQPGSALLA